MQPRWLTVLNQEIVSCRECPRLVEYREEIGRVKRRAYIDQEYWAKPVPGFGDPNARVLIFGLAPGAHGSNRTGRPFTGDGSGAFMYPVLYQAGFASQPASTNRGDGMKLTDAYITAAGKCAPPLNKPTPQELASCSRFLDVELEMMKSVRVIVLLGRIAYESYLRWLRRSSHPVPKAMAFKHGAYYRLANGHIALCSYHPSLQNTNTGKLTEAMFLKIFQEARRLAETGAEKPSAGNGRAQGAHLAS